MNGQDEDLNIKITADGTGDTLRINIAFPMATQRHFDDAVAVNRLHHAIEARSRALVAVDRDLDLMFRDGGRERALSERELAHAAADVVAQRSMVVMANGRVRQASEADLTAGMLADDFPVVVMMLVAAYLLCVIAEMRG